MNRRTATPHGWNSDLRPHSFVVQQNESLNVRRQPSPPTEIAIRRLDDVLVAMRSLALPVPQPDGDYRSANTDCSSSRTPASVSTRHRSRSAVWA